MNAGRILNRIAALVVDLQEAGMDAEADELFAIGNRIAQQPPRPRRHHGSHKAPDDALGRALVAGVRRHAPIGRWR